MNSLIKKIFLRDDIGEPPYEYDLLINLEDNKYPEYLKKMFKVMTGRKLNLKHPRTFNEKIQWLKLYDATPIKTSLTDKVKVRDWIKEKIGEQYLKPVLWIGNKFDDIPFDSLPVSFIIKTNHGCKWMYKIMNKDRFIKGKELYTFIKNRFDGWMNQTFFPWAGFEMQYKNIEPKLIIEPILTDENKACPTEYEIYCFNGNPKIIQEIEYCMPAAKISVYDENYKRSEILLNPEYVEVLKDVEENLKTAVKLSKILCKDFKLVRVDWILYNNHIYFNEMTFTPFSGFFQIDDKMNLKLGNMLLL